MASANTILVLIGRNWTNPNFRAFQILAKKSDVITLEKIAKLLDYVTIETTIFFDIDETLIIPDTHFIYGNPNTDKWLQNLEQSVDSDSLVKIKNLMEDRYYASPTRLVEEDTLGVFQQLIDRKSKIYGITSRYFDDRTTDPLICRLKELGFQFSDDQVEYKDGPAVFQHGIIFAADQNKGELIHQFLKMHCTYEPRSIVFIDDSFSKCIDVATALADYNCTVIHYTATFDHITQEGMAEQYQEIYRQIFHK
jgi:hypothetical protein